MAKEFLSSLIAKANGAASTPPLALTGTWFTGGTTTTTKPHVLIEPAGTTSTNWSTAGTALGVNAPSGYTGSLLDLQLNGSRRFRVTSSGKLHIAGGTAYDIDIERSDAEVVSRLKSTWSNAIQIIARQDPSSYGSIIYGTNSTNKSWYSGLFANGSDDYTLHTLVSGTTTERWRITEAGVIAYNQPAPTSKSAAATLTIAELQTGIIQYTGAADTLTLPTGTLTQAGFIATYTNMTFQWSVINTGSGTCTIAAGTDHTIIGSATVAAGDSGRFATRRTAANTYVTYRLS